MWTTRGGSSYATTAPKRELLRDVIRTHFLTGGFSNHANISFDQVIDATVQTEEHTVKKYFYTIAFSY